MKFFVRRLVLVVVLVASAASACTSAPDAVSGFANDTMTKPEAKAVAATDATRADVDCTAEGLGEDDESAFVVAHYVVAGQLGALCLGGEEDATLLGAWADLVAITPPDQLRDLGLFAGFVHPNADELPDDAEVTLAFVTAIDDDGSTSLMAIDLDQFDADRDQSLLTVAHEFSHVFTRVPSQLDTSEGAAEACATYRSGGGCFREDSLMAEWVRLFWDDGRLDGFDADADPSVDGGAKRCSADPSFLGEYAASNPEEDFAETFSAFVFALDVDVPELDEKLDWMADQPGLVEFRQRAGQAGLAPLDNTFEGCG